jgi:predicted alpha/beta-hydrolase family hydrolase
MCSPPPVLIMAHGMGAQKDIGLFMYAEKFVEAGMAVLVFDYR